MTKDKLNRLGGGIFEIHIKKGYLTKLSYRDPRKTVVTLTE